ncbi:HAMP domain-containing histidine kinase [Candidatus Saccharibacteria bacterium]|nr:HAMP domain-containing histidine kinase [Candidatus Saccharibacteria bacterium]
MNDEGKNDVYKILSAFILQLQNPLIIIAGKSSFTEDDHENQLAVIQEKSEEALAKIDQIMRMIKLTTSSHALSSASFDIRRSLKQAQTDLGISLKKKRQNIAVKANRKLPPAVGDFEASQMLVLNLIKHCSDLAEPGSEILISLRASENELQLVIRSQGESTKLRGHNRSINKLGAIKQPLVESISVNGLGLFLADELAKKMNGYIRFVPSSGGSCYALSLPTNEQLRLL